MTVDLKKLAAFNSERWTKAQITRDASEVARRLAAAPAKVRYQIISQQTTVPWFIIAVIHEREASQRWDRQLGQGDPLDKVSIHVPKGRGPFSDFTSGAVDALVRCEPFAARWKDWTAGGALTLLEQYNGLGYASKGLPSPYIWSGTDQYKSGKYVSDGVYDPAVVDKQLGCACVLRAMMQLDPTITFTGVRLVPRDVPAPEPKPVPKTIPQPSIWAAFFMAILNFFRGKK